MSVLIVILAQDCLYALSRPTVPAMLTGAGAHTAQPDRDASCATARLGESQAGSTKVVVATDDDSASRTPPKPRAEVVNGRQSIGCQRTKKPSAPKPLRFLRGGRYDTLLNCKATHRSRRIGYVEALLQVCDKPPITQDCDTCVALRLVPR